MYSVRYLGLGLLWMLSVTIVQAHPHSYIDLKAKWLVTENKLTGIAFEWQLDEMTSLSLTYDIFQKMPYPQAMEQIAKELTQNMLEMNFFTHISQNNHPLSFHLKTGSNKTEQNKLKTAFSFILDLDNPILLANKTIHLQTYEPSYYVSISYEDITLINNSDLPSYCQTTLINPNYTQELQNYALSLDVEDAPEEDMNLGKQFSQDIVLTCQ